MWRPVMATLVMVTLAGCTDTGGSPSASSALSPEAEALATRLRSSGLSVEAAGEVEQPFFSVKGQVLANGAEQIQVFTFPSADASAAAASRVSPDGATVGTTSINWVAPPRFYRSEKLVVLYIGRDEKTVAALRTVLGNPFAGTA